MSRIYSQGRDSWRIVNTRRCHSIRIPGALQPMDQVAPRSALKWIEMSAIAWGLIYVVYLTVPS